MCPYHYPKLDEGQGCDHEMLSVSSSQDIHCGSSVAIHIEILLNDFFPGNVSVCGAAGRFSLVYC